MNYQSNLQQLINDASQDGLNPKRLYLATGLRWDDFAKAHRDDLFTSDQEQAIRKEIKEWRRDNGR